jgi:hypothetical protein
MCSGKLLPRAAVLVNIRDKIGAMALMEKSFFSPRLDPSFMHFRRRLAIARAAISPA